MKAKKKKIQSDTPLYVYFAYPLSERNYVISLNKCFALDNRTFIVCKITDTSIGNSKVNKDDNLHTVSITYIVKEYRVIT